MRLNGASCLNTITELGHRAVRFGKEAQALHAKQSITLGESIRFIRLAQACEQNILYVTQETDREALLKVQQLHAAAGRLYQLTETLGHEHPRTILEQQHLARLLDSTK